MLSCSLSALWVHALWMLSECSLSALSHPEVILICSKWIWAEMMKNDCSRELWAGQTNRRTEWLLALLVGAKNDCQSQFECSNGEFSGHTWLCGVGGGWLFLLPEGLLGVVHHNPGGVHLNEVLELLAVLAHGQLPLHALDNLIVGQVSLLETKPVVCRVCTECTHMYTCLLTLPLALIFLGRSLWNHLSNFSRFSGFEFLASALALSASWKHKTSFVICRLYTCSLHTWYWPSTHSNCSWVPFRKKSVLFSDILPGREPESN